MGAAIAELLALNGIEVVLKDVDGPRRGPGAREGPWVR